MLTRLTRRVTLLVLAIALGGAATASAAWTTYHGDALRSGIDTSSSGQLPVTHAWTSAALDGDLWGQPVIDDGLVIVGTEADQVYALNEATGAVAWHAGAGTAVDSGQLPCGDISPTVGITSTPVIDPATQRVFVVADTWDGTHASTIQHELYAFNLATGSLVAGYPVPVDPPGSTHTDQLQRAALALDGSEIAIGYGGNDGDCGNYHGWLVGVPEAGGTQRTFEVDSGPGQTQGAIWGAGDGPAVDAAGNIWSSSGNGSSDSFGDQESVLDLSPSLSLNALWAPSNWSNLDSEDLDLGSTDPLLLPDGLVFQIGKAGEGYLLRTSDLGGEGASPAFEASVCGGSYGGSIYLNGVLYVPCTDGLQALTLNAGAPSFTPLASWNVPSGVNGPPIETGGLIWATDTDSGTLYGLNPQTGQEVVTQSTPAMEHFVSPSASDGKLFLGTGDTVEAYTVANAVTPPGGSGGSPASRASCSVRGPSRGTVTLRYTRRRRHARRRLTGGTLALKVRCSGRARVVVTGTISETVRRAHHRRSVKRIRLRAVRATVAAGKATTVRAGVPLAAVRALQRHVAESARLSLAATSAGGTSHAGVSIRRLRVARR